jgi:hypothetical protein
VHSTAQLKAMLQLVPACGDGGVVRGLVRLCAAKVGTDGLWLWWWWWR